MNSHETLTVLNEWLDSRIKMQEEIGKRIEDNSTLTAINKAEIQGYSNVKKLIEITYTGEK